MNEGRYLDIRIRLEACITQREAMIAENMDRSAKGQAMAYCDDGACNCRIDDKQNRRVK